MAGYYEGHGVAGDGVGHRANSRSIVAKGSELGITEEPAGRDISPFAVVQGEKGLPYFLLYLPFSRGINYLIIYFVPYSFNK